MRTLLVVAAAVTSVVSGCSLFLDYSGITGGCDAGCADVADVAVADVADGAVSDVVVADSAKKDGGCPGQGGPTAVKVDSRHCIDSTEVTNAQYKAFTDAIGLGFTPDKPPGCGFKTTFDPAMSNNGCTPQTFDPSGHPTFPVGCVDWCDAWAFCAWAGKRMCGDTDGGAFPYDTNKATSTESEWFVACSSGGTELFPWGSGTPDDTRCNTTCKAGDAGAPIAVGSDTPCDTPAHVSDMGGNMLEWVNSCGGTASNSLCIEQGDSFAQKTGTYCGECTATLWVRTFAGHDMGIRCCGDLP